MKGQSIFQAITFKNVIFVVVSVFILLQVGFKISSQWFGTMDMRFGFVFQIMIISFALILMYLFIVKKEASLAKKDFFVLLFLLGVLGAMFFFLPRYIPEIFAFDFPNSKEQIGNFMQSIAG